MTVRVPQLTLTAVNKAFDEVWTELELVRSRGISREFVANLFALTVDVDDGSGERLMKISEDCGTLSVWNPTTKTWKTVALT